jgi:hypothetical protein
LGIGHRCSLVPRLCLGTHIQRLCLALGAGKLEAGQIQRIYFSSQRLEMNKNIDVIAFLYRFIPSDRVGNFSLKEDELIATFLVSLVIVKIKEKGKEYHGR